MEEYRGLPVLASDLSGALSILYGLEGVRIVCSAGSCANSYVNFDEFRPFPEKKLYTTRMRMIHAISGEENLLEALLASDLGKDIPFFTLFGTSVPSVIGMDLASAARRMERETGIPTIYIACDGFHSAGDGAAKALLALGKKVLQKRARRPKSVNLIGYDPYLHGAAEGLAPLQSWIREQQLELACDWSAAKTLSDLEPSTEAALNLVLSGSALPLADYMAEEFAIPYEVICPWGNYGLRRLDEIIQRVFHTCRNESPPTGVPKTATALEAVILGEPVFAEGLKQLLRHELGIRKIQKYCYEEAAFTPAVRQKLPDTRFMEIGTLPRWLSGLSPPHLVLGDPLFQRFVNKEVTFISIPDRRLSGNLFPAFPWIGRMGSTYVKDSIHERS